MQGQNKIDFLSLAGLSSQAHMFASKARANQSRIPKVIPLLALPANIRLGC